MGDPGNPSNPNVGPGSEPDPDQPGWASPTPPPPPPPPPAGSSPDAPPPAAPPPEPQAPITAPVPPEPAPTAPQPQAPITAPTSAPAWGTPPPVWGTPPPVAPTPPAAAGGGWTPEPLPKKRRLTWLWILIPVLLVLVASTVVVIVFAVKLALGPVQTTNDYYADLHHRDYAAAYGKLCFAIQRDVPEGRYIALQASDARSKGAVDDYDFSSSHINDGTATTTGTVVRAGQEYNATIGLRKENGDWKVCSIRER